MIDAKKKKKALTIAVILFVITGFLSIMMIVEYINIRQFEMNKNASIKQLTTSEWNYVYSRIQDSYKSAKSQSNQIKKGILNDIYSTYTDKDALKKDLIDCINGKESKLTQIIGSNIENVYFNNIKNDANDPFITSTTKVLSDFSINCSADKRIRTFDKEVSLHFNQALARQALDAIVMQKDKEVFWSFVEESEKYPWYEDIKNMKYMDMDKLKELFFKYKDIRVLESIEFISTAYIYEKKDITDQAVVNYDGTLNDDANQLFINSCFNIVDVIKANPNDLVVVSDYEKQISTVQDEFYEKRDFNYALMIMEGIAFLITLVALASLQRFVLNKK